MTIDHVMKSELKAAMRALLGDKLMELLLEEEKEEEAYKPLSDEEIINRV